MYRSRRCVHEACLLGVTLYALIACEVARGAHAGAVALHTGRENRGNVGLNLHCGLHQEVCCVLFEPSASTGALRTRNPLGSRSGGRDSLRGRGNVLGGYHIEVGGVRTYIRVEVGLGWLYASGVHTH